MTTAESTYQPDTAFQPEKLPEQAPVDPVAPGVTIPAQQTTVAPVVMEQKSSWKETVIWSLVGATGVTISFLLLRKLYREFVSGREESKSLDTDSEANIAKRIKMAFDNDGWPGNNEEALRRVLREIKSKKEWEDVGLSYKHLYNVPLMRDMEDKLAFSELSEMMAIINSKPERNGGQIVIKTQLENWARRLYAAFTQYYWFIPATDEDAVKAVFMEIPTQRVFSDMAAIYQSLFGAKFMDDLKGDMDDWKDYMKMITAKPQG